jgi:hypothetical protein
MNENDKLPWEEGILQDWDIVGMNHYREGGQRHLFVAMTNGGICIRAEGIDSTEVFRALKISAKVLKPYDKNP